MPQQQPSPANAGSTLEQQSLFGDEPRKAVAGEKPPPNRRIVRVQLEGSADLELDYALPDDLAGEVIIGSRLMVPLQKQRVPAVVIELLSKTEHKHKLREALHLVGSRPMFTTGLLRLAHWIADYYIVPVNQVLRTMLPEAVRSKPESFIMDSHLSIAKPWTEEQIEKTRKAAPMQARILETMKAAGGQIALSQLRKESPRAAAIIKPLIKNGWITRSEARVERDPFHSEEFLPTDPLKLTDEQQAAFDATIKAIAASPNAKPILLHGITGSGKTEVYLQAIAEVLARGKTALVLVPEISLTPQTIERFKARFSSRKERIAVLHSMLSDGERHDEWFKIHEGKADIVIGARSAIFAPLENLGIIIVDEEHEPSYKQEESPRYHARDLAVVRGKLEGCAVMLGSATPSLESFENATAGKYELLRMTKRTDNKTLPLIRIVDLRLEKRKGSQSAGILSERLRIAVDARLAKREQVILFLNRRGFNTALSCTACGEAVQCGDCTVPMTLHKKENRLVCHICGSRKIPPSKCPACGDPAIRFGGFGTERVETVIREVFKAARIARVDTDTMQRKHQLRDTLRDFRAQKLDILVGTQMIAKGLDFPNVTLVGVLNADLALHLPDFRAAERTFQLITQVAGRAGRGEVKGEVFVQTFTPHSPAVQFARHGDFDGFAQQELVHRRQFGYPPFSHAVSILSRSKRQAAAEFALANVARRLKQNLPPDVKMGDPAPAIIEKAHGQFRFHLLLRSPKVRALSRHIQQVIHTMTFPSEVTIVWDVDPVQMV